MNEARVPDNNKDWEAIDIYLFSNGQQYTPPRKYHLRSEELNWWDATLGYLARSQYGSMHKTLVLHTLEGRKVGSPMELQDGVAYVAVVPPDTFIQAGYENYLIKATRSWEKRQKKTLQDEHAGAENTTVEGEQTKNTENTNVPEQISNTQTVGMIKTANPENNYQRKNQLPKIPVTTTKTVEKRIYNSAQAQALQRPSILNKHLSDPTQPPLIPRKNFGSRRDSERRDSEKKNTLKESEKKENHRKSFEKRADIRKENEIRQQERRESEKKQKERRDSEKNEGRKKDIENKEQERKERSQSERRESEKNEIDNKDQVRKERAQSEDDRRNTALLVIPHHRSQVTENGDLKNLIDDKDLIVVTNLYKSADSEEVSTLFDPDNIQTMFQSNKENLNTQMKTFEPLTEESKSEVISINYPLSSKKNDVLGISEFESLKKDLTAPDNLVKDQVTVVVNKTDVKQNVKNSEISHKKTVAKDLNTENNPIKDLITVVPDKADRAHLKLNLDARKSDDTKQRNESQKSRSVTDIKEKTDKEIVTQSKSLQSLKTACPPHICCQGNQKVVLLSCACCDYYTQENGCRLEQPQCDNDFRNYFILLPVAGCVEKQCCRPCCQRELNMAEKQVQNTESLNTEVYCQEVMTYPVSDRNTGLEINELITTKYKSSVVKSTSQTLCLEKRVSTSVAQNEVQQTDSVCLKSPGTGPSPTLCDKSVQTDWCNIMLEVRKHEDGHYTFHLPSLEALKSYNVSS